MDTETKKWYESKAILGAIVAVVASLASLAGIQIDLQTQDEIAGYAIALAGIAGGVWSIYGRIKASSKIYSSAEAKAAAQNALLAKIEELEKRLMESEQVKSGTETSE